MAGNFQLSIPTVITLETPDSIYGAKALEFLTQEGDASAEAIRLGLCFFSSMVFDDLDSKQKQLTLKKFAKLNMNLAQPYNGLNTLSNFGQIVK